MKSRILLIVIPALFVAAAVQSAARQNAGVRVSGMLKNIDGTVFNDPNSRVILRKGNAAVGESKIAFDGFFEFTYVSPGDYSVSIIGLAVPISPIIPLHVERTDVGNIEMTVPRPKQVSGQISMEGSGPLPQIRLLLKPLKDPTMNPAVRALSPSGFVTNNSFPGIVPIVPMIDLNPKADGTLALRIPEGDWQVTPIGEFPTGYFITTLTYGNIDILRNPLNVRFSDNAALRFVVTNSSTRLSTVYGRITGLTPAIIARGPMSVILRGPMSPTIPGPISTQQRTAAVHSDGTFIIDQVISGDYSALVTGLDTLDLAVAPLRVAKNDVWNFEIEVNRTEVNGKVVVEGGGPMVTDLTLSFREVQDPVPQIGGIPVVGGARVLSMRIHPLPDGTFTGVLPQETQLMNTGYSSACGYKLQSLIYGATDVKTVPLKVLKSYTSPLQINLTYSECPKR